ncbi:1-acyl-sn-glycerol-3-phosphate acyltransferase [Chelatococcus sp. SYSU_G07232]|uniref:1-acyl-sn-glycerol-3-phosphate acyltransferase n=1 Tax=Chelatococcus albus TaxID=3047466 RepID=A0ABT7ADH3_9HYPH|nr:1-acyl-sn-glycerol-3-phosphate acyltransferase [Chelatococcus sp. SYSU_G07232]MDJ1157431.1 1-acyl-sn-glycerol-3-phosphate acyltransferase [Chelatococcus sp. SYSU_G07232]
MLVLRSALFNLLFYANLIVWMIGALPSLLMPRRAIMRIARAWARSALWLLRVVAGTTVEYRGLENLPPGGCLVACKHQSMWETFALLTMFDDPAFILKRELTFIPFFGWLAWKADMVPVDRSGGAAALAAMLAKARKEARHGRQIVIFPEGTRRPPGAPPAYKAGIAHLYTSLGVPCLPVALNSGLYWPRRKFLRRPGTIRVEFLPPLPPGLRRQEMLAEVERRIEESSDRLLAEGRAELGLADERPAAPARPRSP